ncbi:cytochrome P450 [Kitasatospora sp. NPDC058063]|uniref:cytochrome P450 n=1 Tax=unclassified Kitasatospora TaxID=2633591 RepID=UPI0036DC1EBD
MESSERQLRAQMRFFHDLVRKLAAQGDPYAKVLSAPDNPYPAYEEIRARGRVYRSPLGTWVTTDHELANQVLRDKRFGVRKADGEKVPEFMNFDNSMLGLDPPEHTRLRRMTMPTLNPRVVERWRGRAEEICHRLIDDILAQGDRFDLMTAFAHHLPTAVIGDLVGIPEEDREHFHHLSREIVPLLDGVVTYEKARSVDAAIAGMTELFTRIVEQRRVEPREDMISRMLPLVDEGSLSMDELLPLCMFLPLAGTETTVNLIGNGILALLRHPEQWRMVAEDPELAQNVVNETLRHDPPVQTYRRIAHEPVELGGVVLPVDSELAIVAAGANRDPQVFPDPARFDITRVSRNDTLAFSAGIHYCLGAPLARFEAEVAYRTLISRMPGLRQAGPVRRRGSFIIRGLREFPLSAS